MVTLSKGKAVASVHYAAHFIDGKIVVKTNERPIQFLYFIILLPLFTQSFNNLFTEQYRLYGVGGGGGGQRVSGICPDLAY